LCYVVCATSLASQSPAAFDQQLRDHQRRLEDIRRERTEVEQELERLRTQVHSLSDELSNIERQKESTNRIVNELDRQINGLSDQSDRTTVDLLLAQDALEEKRAVLERVLREQQVHRRAIDLIGEAVDLAVELVHDAVGTLFLPLDVRELVGERMHLGAEPLQLLLDLCPLAADVFQSPLVISQLLVEGGGALRGQRRCTNDVAQRRHAQSSRHGSTPHTFRK